MRPTWGWLGALVLVGTLTGILVWLLFVGLSCFRPEPRAESTWDSIWIAIASCVAVATLVSALFKNYLTDLIFPARLCVRFDMSRDFDTQICQARDLQGVPWAEFYRAHYMRLWVFNRGPRAARRVHVMAEKVSRVNCGESIEIPAFRPMNLMWSHGEDTYLEQLSADSGFHCAVLEIIDPEYRLASHAPKEMEKLKDQRKLEIEGFDAEKKIVYGKILTQARPLSAFHMLEPGDYEIELKVLSTDFRKGIPVRLRFCLGQKFALAPEIAKQRFTMSMIEPKLAPRWVRWITFSTRCDK